MILTLCRCFLSLALVPVAVSAAAPVTSSPSSPPPASRPAPLPTVEQTVQRLVEKANQVLTEPLAPGATAGQAKVVVAERGDRVQRLAEPLVGQRVSVLTPIADVVETAKDKTLPQTTKLAAKGQFVVAQPSQVEADWRKRMADIAADYEKRIKAKNPFGFKSATEEDKKKRLKTEQAEQQLNLPRATVVVFGDDAYLARRRGGEAMRVEGIIRKIDFVPWSPVSTGLRYDGWSREGRLVVTVEMTQAPAK